MKFPMILLLAIAFLSFLIPIPYRFFEDGSVLRELLRQKWIPNYVLVVILQPSIASVVAYIAAFRLLHFAISFPIRMFFSRFGFDIQGFSGTSFSGLFISVRIKRSIEVVIRIDKIGVDIRTMRRLRKRIAARWSQIKARFRPSQPQTNKPVSQPVHSKIEPDAGCNMDKNSSEPSQPSADCEPSCGPSTLSNSDKNLPQTERQNAQDTQSGVERSGGLSKRLQAYAQGVHITVLLHTPSPQVHSTFSSMWFDKEDDDPREDSMGTGVHQSQQASTATEADGQNGLDRETRRVSAKIASRISTVLRTYTYFASLFARWIDISITDIRIAVSANKQMIHAGHGITMQISNLTLWAASSRENRNNDSDGWFSGDSLSFIFNIGRWIVNNIKRKFSRGSDETEGTSASSCNSDNTPTQAHKGTHNSTKPTPSTSEKSPCTERLSCDSSTQTSQNLLSQLFTNKRSRGHKYLSTLGIDAKNIRLFPGMEGVQRHINSRWELVKMLVLQDMLPSKGSHDTGKSYKLGQALYFHSCTLKSDVITSFWGLPKKVDQRIELTHTHIRAGIIDALFDELAILRYIPLLQLHESGSLSVDALRSQLSSILNRNNKKDKSTDSIPHTEPRCMDSSDFSEAQKLIMRVYAKQARDRVNYLLFKMHEVLSKLKLERVGIALSMDEIVFDLPLTKDEHDNQLVVSSPRMFRLRQKNFDTEAGYLWNTTTNVDPPVSDAIWNSSERTASIDIDRKSALGIEEIESSDLKATKPNSSTAYFKMSSGTIRAIALKTPSMTADPRAEELVSGSPGFNLKSFTLYGEMSAFLSEDLSSRPSPQPEFSLDISCPEMLLDLHTQLAFDEVSLWMQSIIRSVHTIRDDVKESVPHFEDTPNSRLPKSNYQLYAILVLIFPEAKFHMTVESAVYSILPCVQFKNTTVKSFAKSGDTITSQLKHLELHAMWVLSGIMPSYSHTNSLSDGDDSDDSDSDDSLVNEPGGPADIPNPDNDAPISFTPLLKFQLSSSPITGAWGTTSVSNHGSSDTKPRACIEDEPIYVVKRGVRARGTASFNIGPTADFKIHPKVDLKSDIDVGEASFSIHEREFREWLSMQPIWIVTRIMRKCGLGYDNGASADDSTKNSTIPKPQSLEERRKKLTATTRISFDNVSVTVLACDNEEDISSGIEHGVQLSFNKGFVDLHVNGGSLASPHMFGLYPDSAKTTFNIECNRASMFLFSAVPKRVLRSSNKSPNIPLDFDNAGIGKNVPDSIQSHIVITRPQCNFSRQKLEAYRSKMIIDLKATAINSLVCVSSVYRWSVFMHHVNYWRRRRKLAQRMATQFEPPSPPDDLIIRINSELFDLQGDLVSPIFNSIDKGVLGAFNNVDEVNKMTKAKCPQMKFTVPQVRFSIEKTKDKTDSDVLISLDGPIATLYGASTPRGQTQRTNMQPIISLEKCKARFRFPRKAKRAKLGEEQGVRRNSTYEKIDIEFENGAISIGHKYNMAETMDGYVLLQKSCKRIARASMATCHPPIPFIVSALQSKPTEAMVISTLADPRTYMPPPLRAMTGTIPSPPPPLVLPDDVPTIDIHGPELNVLIQDDPFETALSNIFQVGLREQNERLNRLEVFQTKAQEIRKRRKEEYFQNHPKPKNTNAPSSSRKTRKNKTSSRSHHRHCRHQHRSTKAMKGSNTFSSYSPTPSNDLSTLPHSSTFTANRMQKGPLGSSNSSNDKSRIQNIASASVQDVSSLNRNPQIRTRPRTNSAISSDGMKAGHGYRANLSKAGRYTESVASAATSDDDSVASSMNGDTYQKMLDSVEDEINAAYQRLLEVESREWIKAIRKKMVPPSPDDTCYDTVCPTTLDEVFSRPRNVNSSCYHEKECGIPEASPPYNYMPGSWIYPPIPLGRLLLTPVWISLDTPLSLLEFDQIENYLRHLDPTTPHKLEWSTLIPMRVRVRSGDTRLQIRDYPFPLFRVPDPYRAERLDTEPSASVSSYEELCGGVELSTSFVIAERVAHGRSLRSVYIPVGPRSKDDAVDLSSVGWHISKSLQFPRIFTAMSILLFSVPMRSFDSKILSHEKNILSRLPSLPIISTWGASYQPAMTALMQRVETATSKSADVSPTIPWWDKFRSRMHFKCRMAVIDAPTTIISPSNSALNLKTDDITGSFSTNHNSISGDSTPNQTQDKNPDNEGQMFFLTLDGRSPYQSTQEIGGFLFAMRGGVRVSINEGIPEKNMWDEKSGQGIYSVPTEDGIPPPGTMGEFLRLRCKEFLMGVPIIVDRQSELLQLIKMSIGIDASDYVSDSTLDGFDIDEIARNFEYNYSTQNASHVPNNSATNTSSPLSGTENLRSLRVTQLQLLRKIAFQNSTRYTLITNNIDRLYHKVTLRLSGGVRVGIGLSSYIPPDSSGFRRNHWEIQPIAPEHASEMSMRGITDAYVGYRATKLHAGVSLLCPFVDTNAENELSFADIYLVNSENTQDPETRDDSAQSTEDNDTYFRSASSELKSDIPHLRVSGPAAKEHMPRKWTTWETDTFVSPLHRLIPTKHRPSNDIKKQSKSVLHDVFFTPFPQLVRTPHTAKHGNEYNSNSYPSPQDSIRSNMKPQCCIYGSSEVVDGVSRYLSLFISRMMLPVKKGSLYPYNETSDIKLIKSVRSARLLLDLKNVELGYSQRDSEIKEIETKELIKLGYDNVVQDAQTASALGGEGVAGHTILGAKSEGIIRELKARIDSFSFNLLLEQRPIKLKMADRDTSTSQTPESGTPMNGIAGDSGSVENTTNSSSQKAKAQKIYEMQALRWMVGDASTEINYIDVRLVQMSFAMPLFIPNHGATCEKMSGKNYINGLMFSDGAYDELAASERSWLSPMSIRELNELDLSEAMFSDPQVISVLWSPRLVYFTQKPEWTLFNNTIDDVLDLSLSEPKDPGHSEAVPDPSSNKNGSNESGMSKTPNSGGFSYENAINSLSNVAGHGRPRARQSVSRGRNRANSEVRYMSRSSSKYSDANAVDNTQDGIHKRNPSMPWGKTWHGTRDSSKTGSGLSKATLAPEHPSIDTQGLSPSQRMQMHSQSEVSITPDSNYLTASCITPTIPIRLTTTQINSISQQDPTESVIDAKSQYLAVSYKSSRQLLELARSRQRRLTTSIQSNAPGVTLTQQQHNYNGEQSLASTHQTYDDTISNNLDKHVIPEGPDLTEIMRDSRSTQAMLLMKRKAKLGAAIQQEQGSLTYLSHKFEQAPNKYNEDFRKEMFRRAGHIYELGARRKLINNCLKFLGVDPMRLDNKDGPEITRQFTADDFDLDRDARVVENLLASLYRHRCLIYSGYLIWTSQVRDILMRFLYFQDCLNAIQYYMSESATRVARDATSGNSTTSKDKQDKSKSKSKGKGKDSTAHGTSSRRPSKMTTGDTSRGRVRGSNPENEWDDQLTDFGFESAHSDIHEPAIRAKDPIDQTKNNASLNSSKGQHNREENAQDILSSLPPRPQRASSDRCSIASTSSRRTRQLPKLLRKLRSNDKFGPEERATKPRNEEKNDGKGSSWRDKRSEKKKTKTRRKEEYKPSANKTKDNKFDDGLKRIWDDFSRYHPYYSFLVEFLNSQVSMRVDEKESSSSIIAVAERVQLHRILLCDEGSIANEAGINSASIADSSAVPGPPEDEAIVKTRSLVELENVQVFATKRSDFENQSAYLVDCTYGSRYEAEDHTNPGVIWPAWIPIEILLSQGSHKPRGIFEEEGVDSDDDSSSCNSSSSINEGSSLNNRTSADQSGYKYADASANPNTKESDTHNRKKKHKRVWWLEDLSKYNRLMDRNNGLLVYDKANPQRILGDNSDVYGSGILKDDRNEKDHASGYGDDGSEYVRRDSSTVGNDSHLPDSSSAAVASEYNNSSVNESIRSKISGSQYRQTSNHKAQSTADASVDNTNSQNIHMSYDDEDGSSDFDNSRFSHRASHFSVFLPELEFACTAEHYISIYETVTELLVYSDPAKAVYMDQLNTIQLGVDMSDLRGLLKIIHATQDALRERAPIIQEWYTVQNGTTALYTDMRKALPGSEKRLYVEEDFPEHQSRAVSILTLDRHYRALEMQLRMAMDIFSAAQKQKKLKGLQKQRHRGHGQHQSQGSESIASHENPQFSALSSRSTTKGYQPTTAPNNPPSTVSDAASQARIHESKSLASSDISKDHDAGDEQQGAIARTINIFVSKATWHMLENDGQPLCDMTLRWGSLNAVTTSDQATQLLMEVHLLYIVNKLPNPMFTDLVGPYLSPKFPRPDFRIEKMIRVKWSALAPVGGISIIERFEVDLFPLRLQLSHDLAHKLTNYLYPPQDTNGPSNTNSGSKGSESASNGNLDDFLALPVSNNSQSAANNSESAQHLRSASPSKQQDSVSTRSKTKITCVESSTSLFKTKMRKEIDGQSVSANSTATSSRSESVKKSNSSSKSKVSSTTTISTALASGMLFPIGPRIPSFSVFSDNSNIIDSAQRGDNHDQIDQMKRRASSNKTFLYIKIAGSSICISYQGKKASNFTDLRDFEFHVPTLELRNQVESYYELLMQVKREYISVALQHTGALVKEKFRQLHNRKAWSKTSFGPDWEARNLLLEMDRSVEMDMISLVQNTAPIIETPGSSIAQSTSISEECETSNDANAKEPGDISGRQPARINELDESADNLHASDSSSTHSHSYSVASKRLQGKFGRSLSIASDSNTKTTSDAASAMSGGKSDDTMSLHSTKGKAPISKYMLLDPRKLMGKRLPNMLPRSPAQLDSKSVDGLPLGSGSRKASTTKQQQSQNTATSLTNNAVPFIPIPKSGGLGFQPLYSAMHIDLLPTSVALQARRRAKSMMKKSENSSLPVKNNQVHRTISLERGQTLSPSPKQPSDEYKSD